MVRKPSSPAAVSPLTPTELEMMSVIWQLGPCTVQQVIESLAPGRELAYSSVSTIVRILEQKGYVKSTRKGRGHLYRAAVSKQAYQAQTLGRLVSQVFDDRPALVVQQLLSSGELSEEELREIRTLLRGRGS
jgi:predicted transcriptional regulator